MTEFSTRGNIKKPLAAISKWSLVFNQERAFPIPKDTGNGLSQVELSKSIGIEHFQKRGSIF